MYYLKRIARPKTPVLPSYTCDWFVQMLSVSSPELRMRTAFVSCRNLNVDLDHSQSLSNVKWIPLNLEEYI